MIALAEPLLTSPISPLEIETEEVESSEKAQRNLKVLKIMVILSTLFAIAELAVGIVSDSTVLISDAGSWKIVAVLGPGREKIFQK